MAEEQQQEQVLTSTSVICPQIRRPWEVQVGGRGPAVFWALCCLLSAGPVPPDSALMGPACWSCVTCSVVYLLLDPMNTLTNLTGVGGGPGAIGMGPRPTGAPVGGMGAMGPMQIGQHAMAGVAGNPQASECV